EYQDTNDLQEALMALIVNNNNYMVGDIKQAIYRFRQANPYIFKNKYDSYSKHIGGEKIDLVKNFRSRKEVLDTVNDVFESIMDDFLGGADYKNGHCMVFGNKNYEELGNNDLNHHLSIYQYENNSLEFSNPLIEVFLIAKDILKKIKDEYTIFDKDTNTLRRAVFSDFAILMDRATNFSLYKKVFEYLHIPLTVITDSKLTSNIELDVIKNLFKIVIATKNNCFDNSFKHALVSVLRSFLIKMSDDDIYKLIASNGYLTSSFYGKIKEIVLTYDFLGANDLLDKLLSTFNYYDNLISLGNVEEGITRIFYIKSLIKDLALNGYSILDVYNYLEDVLKGKLEIKYKEVVDENNAVKIMTIHKSKGLEYPLCYFSGLSSPFNIRDIQEKMLIDQKYGLILPYKDDYLRQSFVLSLVKKNYMEEEISEKIRLFYVALTRAKEKIIFILPKGKEKELKTDEIGVIVNTTRLKYRSFKDMLNSIYEKLLPYVEEINVSELNITKEYLNSNIEKMDLTSSIKLDVKEEPLPQIAKGKESFSKQNKMVIKKDENMARLLGIHFHEILEYIDFFNPLPYLKDEDTYIKNKVLAFLNSSFLKSLDIEKIVREYSFIENDTIGRIDLIIFTKKTQIIIDYKLKNIKDEAYIKQLNGYKTFLKTKDKRVVKMYLYSIIDEMFYELEG
ncbi:MAG: 3'-5' exonuclease, partial [Bacilli bacterium]